MVFQSIRQARVRQDNLVPARRCASAHRSEKRRAMVAPWQKERLRYPCRNSTSSIARPECQRPCLFRQSPVRYRARRQGKGDRPCRSCHRLLARVSSGEDGECLAVFVRVVQGPVSLRPAATTSTPTTRAAVQSIPSPTELVRGMIDRSRSPKSESLRSCVLRWKRNFRTRQSHLNCRPLLQAMTMNDCLCEHCFSCILDENCTHHRL